MLEIGGGKGSYQLCFKIQEGVDWREGSAVKFARYIMMEMKVQVHPGSCLKSQAPHSCLQP